MVSIGQRLSSKVKKEVSFDNRLCNAYLAAGKGEVFLDCLQKELDCATEETMESVRDKFPRGGAMGCLKVNLLYCEAQSIWDEYLAPSSQIMFQKGDFQKGFDTFNSCLDSGVKLEDINRTALLRLKSGLVKAGIKCSISIPKKSASNNHEEDEDSYAGEEIFSKSNSESTRSSDRIVEIAKQKKRSHHRLIYTGTPALVPHDTIKRLLVDFVATLLNISPVQEAALTKVVSEESRGDTSCIAKSCSTEDKARRSTTNAIAKEIMENWNSPVFAHYTGIPNSYQH
ncbi:unnamed protein product [Lepeophtheirus salmonis]|uniref:(salmon louse) hypothetical protein n=1 Tax=Lepeophtheirus salmonis TaxID=72036 RepID=A0A7R8H8Z9_LEPSM|nr:unnamed protein product [Lepeophtheirus salmonis]CAF2950645.1 unnamed protein product [Lepeophtheirus salmonis]